MSRSPSKGVLFERMLCRLFESKGYRVTHNIKLRGRSGAEHQIDLLVEYECPLHISRVIIEAKAYTSPINKEKVMKLIQIVDDLGVDRGIIITTSYFTPGAVEIAKGRNIDLWDRKKLLELLGEAAIEGVIAEAEEQPTPEAEIYIMPRKTLSEARAVAEGLVRKRAKGGLFGFGKVIEYLEEVLLVYVPYYEIDIQATITESRPKGIFGREFVRKMVMASVCFDGITGESVSYTHLTLPTTERV